MARVREIVFDVEGFPPAKNEALSMLGAGHSHLPRVVRLLRAAAAAVERDGFQPFETGEPLGLEVVLRAPVGKDPWDATNYLGGVADALEEKSRRGVLEHLGDLRDVFLYPNDRQIREIHYRQESGIEARYAVRIWSLHSQHA